MIPRDHRDDGDAISGVFFALPLSVGVWLVVLGAIVSPWLMLAGGVLLAYGLIRLLEGSSE